MAKRLTYRQLVDFVKDKIIEHAAANRKHVNSSGQWVVMVQDVYFPTYRFNREEASAIVINAARELNLDTKDLHFGLK